MGRWIVSERKVKIERRNWKRKDLNFEGKVVNVKVKKLTLP